MKLNHWVQAIVFVAPFVSFSQSWQWAKSPKGSGIVYGICTTKGGGVVITGHFYRSSVSFGGITLYNSSEDSADMYVVKYNASGNVLWAKSAGDIGLESGHSIATDSKGNIFVTGYFNSPTLRFGNYTLINRISGNPDNIHPGAGYSKVYEKRSSMFLVKYDSSGNVLWAVSTGGTGQNEGYALATDPGGNAVVAGFFNCPKISFGSYTLKNKGHGDIFMVKYNGLGDVIWAKSAGEKEDDQPTGIATDSRGDALVTGYFNSDYITFGKITLKGAGMFIVKYDSAGNAIWAKRAGTNGLDEGTSVACDVVGNVYVTGFFAGSCITFGDISCYRAGMFLVKYDASGNILWANRLGGNGIDESYGIALDPDGNIYITGFINKPGMSIGKLSLKNAGMFLAKYSNAGEVIWAKSAGMAGKDEGDNLSIDENGNVYLAGYYSSPEFALGDIKMDNPGGGNMFLAKLAKPKVAVVPKNAVKEISVLLNPSKSKILITFPDVTNGFKCNIIAPGGGKVYSSFIAPHTTSTEINVEKYINGLYLVNIAPDNVTKKGMTEVRTVYIHRGE